MLNRRQIRVRAMQSLYAYKQADGANFSLAQDLITDTFSPNLNSMEHQDKEKLEGFRKLGQLIFEENFSRKTVAEDAQETPQNVRLAVEKSIDFYHLKCKKDAEYYQNRSITEAEKVYDLYLLTLSLFVEIAERAVMEKLNSKTQLADNQILNAIIHDKNYELQIIRRGINWNGEQVLVSKIYREVIRTNETYLAYCAAAKHTLEEDFSLLKYLLKNVILKHETTWDFFEKQDLYWHEDVETLRAMVSHTFQSAAEGALKIETLEEDWQESRDFLQTLYNKSIAEAKNLEEMLLPKLKNWEMERIADTDQILLKMALIEMMNYPSIPVKVTINEIIEIAKEYSTPKSGQFLNGVLDILSKELLTSGKIRKSGRGMLDNK